MKLRVGKKVLAYDFEESKWVKAKIVHIDHQEGMVSVKDVEGFQWESDITEFDDPDCFREK